MESILAHLQSNAVFYIIGAVVAIPIIYFTRPYSISVIQWVVELAIYGTGLHLFVAGLVRVINGFQYETQMKMLADERVNQGWTTPIYQFWNLEAYNPQWVAYLEAGMLFAIFLLMLRFRPMKVQKRFSSKEVGRKGYTPRSKPPGDTAGRGGRSH
ncbi:MAG: hypothetical protein AMXMBFR84_30880 [Candidatus Hydrogenedentota bacterium]